MDAKFSGKDFVNPFLALHNIFSSIPLLEMRNDLSELKTQLFERSYLHEEGSIPYDNAKYLLEQVDKILKAAHLLYRMHVDSLVHNYGLDNSSSN